MHMMKEEKVLFPYIVRMEEAVIQKEPILPPPFGSVQNPVSMMEHEHESAGEALRALREASGGYTLPPRRVHQLPDPLQALASLKRICISTSIWKTTSCFLGRSRWKGHTDGEPAMSALPTRVETEAGPVPHARRRSSRSRRCARSDLSRLLILYISTGLGFMLLPGTFLGVWNLIAISSHRSAIRCHPRGFRPTGMHRSSAGSERSSWASASIPFPSLPRLKLRACGLCGRAGRFGRPASPYAG